MQLNPGNPFAAYIYLEAPDENGDLQPITDAPGIVARFSDSKADTNPADPALEVAITHVGQAGSIRRPPGTWLILFGADVVTPVLCDPLFGAARTVHLFVVADDVVLIHSEMPYVMREARVVA